MKTTVALTLALFLMILSTEVKANDIVKPAQVEIKYLGTLDGKPLFEINFNNAEEEGVFLSIRDEFGTTLYTETVKAKKYSRKVQFEDPELNNLKLTLAIRSKKGQQTQSFKISKNTRVLEDIQVAKL